MMYLFFLDQYPLLKYVSGIYFALLLIILIITFFYWLTEFEILNISIIKITYVHSLFRSYMLKDWFVFLAKLLFYSYEMTPFP